MSDTANDKTQAQWAAFQKIWGETLARMMQAGFTMPPSAPPPELLREVRSGIFKTLAQSWEDFMRSPEFVEAMRQLMDQAIGFRKMSNDLFAMTRNQLQAPTSDDIESIQVSLRQIEACLEGLSARVRDLSERVPAPRLDDTSAGPGAKRGRNARRAAKGVSR